MRRDPYTELGVTPEAGASEIRAAYLRLMREHHPDHHGSTERASRLNAAYDLLSQRSAPERHAATGPAPPARALRAAYSEQRAQFSRSLSAATMRVAAVVLLLGTLLLLLAAQ